MKHHTYFAAEVSSLIIKYPGERKPRNDGALAIFCGEAPRRNAQGKTVMSMRAPLLLVTDWFTDPAAIADDVVKILNANAAEFFPSAKTKAQRQADHDRRVLAGEI